MTLTLAAGNPTLADRVFSRRLATDIVLVAAGAALVSLLAQVTIPLPFVPITGQTMAVLIVGATLGATRGGLSLALYLVLGLFLPVYSPQDDGSHKPGFDVIVGPTGGYIFGFILSAVLVGWLAQRQWDRKILKVIVTFLAGSAATFAIGLPWLGVWFGANGIQNDVPFVLEQGLYPFIIGGIIKALLAAGIIRLSWFAVQKLDAHADEADALK
jgi:biotin transport system substrate-specific component